MKSGAILVSGKVGGALFGLARNVLIARLISVENFGVAATFSLIIAVLDLASDLGLDRMLIQAKDGNASKFQRVAQFISVARGIVLSAILFVGAPIFANFFGLLDLAWAFQVLAISPLLSGLSNLDNVRAQRKMNFAPTASLIFFPQFIALILAVPFCLVFDDFRAPLYVSLLQTALAVVLSHIIATRAYRWSVDKALVLRFLIFGWPLVLNGIIISVINQGDRALVGRFFSIEEFATFSAAYSLVYLVVSILVNILQTYFLPILSNPSKKQITFQQKSLVVTQTTIIFGALIVFGSALLGPSVLIILYGPDYSAGVSLMALIGGLQGIRIARSSFNIVAIAANATKITLFMSLARIIGFLLAILFALKGADIESLLLCSIFGEILAFGTGGVFLKLRNAIRYKELISTLVFFSLCSGLTIITAVRFMDGSKPLFEILIGFMVIALVFPPAIFCMKKMRIGFRNMVKNSVN